MSRVPKTKKVLNTHLSLAEHAHLVRRAVERADTITNVVRSFIRDDMRVAEAEDRRREQADRDEEIAIRKRREAEALTLEARLAAGRVTRR